jgi:hypothetical protein
MALSASLSLRDDLPHAAVTERLLFLAAGAGAEAAAAGLRLASPGGPDGLSNIVMVDVGSRDTRIRLRDELARRGVAVGGYGDRIVLGIHFFNTQVEIAGAVGQIAELLGRH